MNRTRSNYSWRCHWCGTVYSGPYRESVEREREHRVSCTAAPRDLTPQPGKTGTVPQAPDRYLPAGKKYVSCSLGNACHIFKAYWGVAGYKGEICCVPRPCIFLVEG